MLIRSKKLEEILQQLQTKLARYADIVTIKVGKACKKCIEVYLIITGPTVPLPLRALIKSLPVTLPVLVDVAMNTFPYFTIATLLIMYVVRSVINCMSEETAKQAEEKFSALVERFKPRKWPVIIIE